MASFLALLADMRNGEAIPRLDDELTELMDSICEHQAAGTMVLKLKITPDKLENFRVVGVKVEYAIEAKPPTEKAGTSVFYVGEKGELSRENARQMNLEMQVEEAHGRQSS
jgi:hypothetical protein